MSQEIEVGQRWFGLRPGAYAIVEVVVDEITEKTIQVRQENWVFTGWGFSPLYQRDRYLKGQFTFIELLPPKSPPVYVVPAVIDVQAPNRPTVWERVKGWIA